MIEQFQAIFENGVLRPLTPLSLPEHAEVSITLCAPAERSDQQVEILRQKAARDTLFAEIDKLPQAPNSDGLSNRDHDKILYGSPK